jgi:tight adherence protein B
VTALGRLLAAAVTVALALAMGLAPATAAAAAETAIEPTAVDVSRYPIVTMTFAVPGAAGAEWQASVVEGGQVRPTTLAAGATTANEVVLVLDTSGSMAGAPIEAAKAAALAFVRTMPPSTRAALVGFGTSPAVHSGLTGDAGALAAAIGGLRAGGETALYDALDVAAGLFSPAIGPRSALLVSDGGDTRSRRPLAEVSNRLVSLGVRVFGVRLLTSETNDGVLAELAAATHGRTVDARNPAELAATYAAVAQAATQQLTVSYRTASRGTTPTRVELTSGTTAAVAVVPVPLPAAAAIAGGSSQAPRALPAPDPARAAEAPRLAIGALALFVSLVLLGRLAFDSRPRSLLAGSHPDRPAGPIRAVRATINSALERSLESTGRRMSLGVRLEAAGLTVRPAEYLTATGTLALGAVAVAALFGGMLVALVVGTVVVVGAKALLSHRTKRRRAALERQLPDLLLQLIGSLRAGYGIRQALDTAARETAAPMGDELRRLVHEIQLGRDLGSSLDALAARTGGEDISWVTQAIEINHEVGGDLADALHAVEQTTRDRERLRRRIRTLSAQGRLSARILIGMPFFVAAAVSAIDPGYFDPLLHRSAGTVLVGVAASLMVLGMVWMRRIVQLRF